MKRTGIIALCMTMMLLGGCVGSTAVAKESQDYPLKIWKQNVNGNYMTMNVVDEETGVNYVVVVCRNSGAYQSPTIAITPRLNADGTLYVSK